MRNAARLPILLLLLAIGLISCEEDPVYDAETWDGRTLISYLRIHENTPLSGNLLACAAGERNFRAVDVDHPIGFFYLPKEEEMLEVRYFETNVLVDNPDSIQAYFWREAERTPVFNGFMEEFRLEEINREKYGRVAILTKDSLFLSAPVRIRYPREQTVIPDDLVQVELEDPTRPLFLWSDDPQFNPIYLTVITGPFGNVITAIYTEEQMFQFYNLQNILTNLNPVFRNPVLTEGENYTFTLFGVGTDNWVQTYSRQPFQAVAP